jgi:type IV secretion system protein VirB10
MTEPIKNQQTPEATVPEQPEATSPLKKSTPVIIALVCIVGLIGIVNLSSLLGGGKKATPASTMPQRPASANPQQVSSFESQQRLQAGKDADDRQHQQELAALQRQIQAQQSIPGPEAPGTAPMTSAQRSEIYGNSSNGPNKTSNVSQAQAEAKQRTLVREKLHQDAVESNTVAIDFAHPSDKPGTTAALGEREDLTSNSSAETIADTGDVARETLPKKDSKTDPMKGYDFDQYQGRLYRVFEGTVLEGVVTNHIDGGLSGPILVMLTTDYYSHDHQQLLMPQGTRLIGSVQSVGNAQQRKMFVTFHRAVCPDGFSLDFDKYMGLDPLGTTGLATNVDHGYLQAFAAAAAVGGLGGLAQIGNGGSVLSPSTQIQNGISGQSAQEAEQILNHFLNRLPIITLNEGSRARIYIGRDILIPSYAEHRVDPTL